MERISEIFYIIWLLWGYNFTVLHSTMIKNYNTAIDRESDSAHALEVTLSFDGMVVIIRFYSSWVRVIILGAEDKV